MRIKKLTKKQRRGEDAFNEHQRLVILEKDRRCFLLNIAAILFNMKERQWYKDILGDEDAKWSAYLSQVELMFSRHHVKYLIGIYHYFILQREISIDEVANYPFSRLTDIIKFANSDEKVDMMLEVALVATPQDWRDTVKEVQGKTTSEDCEHLFADIKICEHCGKKVKN